MAQNSLSVAEKQLESKLQGQGCCGAKPSAAKQATNPAAAASLLTHDLKI